jgi:outer membrane protein
MVVAIGSAFFVAGPAAAQTDVGVESLSQALASAYQNNPTLNAQRADLRATDEGVPQALAGYRPTVSAAGQISATSGSSYYPGSVSLTIEQPLYVGGRTVNGVNIAETTVLAGREVLRDTEQNTLLSAAQAFMNLVEAQALVNLRRDNVGFLSQQGKAAQDRLNVGEGTKTDVAQTNAAIASGQADLNAAIANLNTAIAVYEQIVGHHPKSLGAAKPIDNLLAKTLNAALADAMTSHPQILAAGYNIDIADYNVKIAEGALLPTVSLSGTLTHAEGSSVPTQNGDSATAVARLSVPIYQGGEAASKVRQAKESLSERRIQLDASRDAVREAVISAWGSLDAARAQIRAADAQVTASNLALSGVIEEQKVGQATQLDVLNSQQSLLNARVAQVTAQHDRVIASYTLLAASGGLSAEKLGLAVPAYDPTLHYTQVRDKWGGLRTPDGR